jgi:hypothetical protein
LHEKSAGALKVDVADGRLDRQPATRGGNDPR